jgi:cob(I)alamin adenosyltransferase
MSRLMSTHAPTFPLDAASSLPPSDAARDNAAPSDAAPDDDAHRQRMRELKKAQDEKVKRRDIKRGVIIVNTGHGKGKSTAAFGLALRAAGVGHRVGIVQFIKGTWKTGEKAALARLSEIEHVVSGEGFTWNTQDRQRDIAAARRGWEKACDMIERSRGESPAYQLVILDELCIALRYGYLPIEEVTAVLSGKPEMLNVAVTGRDAPAELIEIADTVTEMRAVKHAFEQGVRAQKGIEF